MKGKIYMSTFCPKCGNKLNDKETYCSSCGSYLRDSTLSVESDISKTNDTNMSTAIHAIFDLFKTIFNWITNKLDKLYQKRYGKDYSSLSSDEKYATFYNEIGKSTKLLYQMMFGTIVAFILYGYTQNDLVITIYSLAIIIPAFLNLSCMAIYLHNVISSKWAETATKLITGLVISFFLVALSVACPPVAVILLGFTIYKNWKRREFLDQYKRYTRILIKGFAILAAAHIACAIFEFIAKRAAIKLQTIISYDIERISEAKLISLINDAIWRISLYEALGICSILLGFIIWNKCYLNFYRKEQINGIPYDKCVKLTWLVPLTWLMLAFSYLTLIHSSSFNGDSLLADVDSNMNTDIDIDTNIAPDIDTSITSETYLANNSTSDISNNMTSSPNIDNNNNSALEQNALIDKDNLNNDANPLPQNNNSNFVPVSNNTLNTDATTENNYTSNTESITPNNSIESNNNLDVNQKASFEVYNTTGTLEEKIVQTDEHTFTIQDSQSMMEGTIHVGSITGDMSLDDSLGIHQGTITNDGIIKGVDELTDGHIKTEYNGERIILDDKNQTIGHILKNGIITDAKGMPLGNIKEC